MSLKIFPCVSVTNIPLIQVRNYYSGTSPATETSSDSTDWNNSALTQTAATLVKSVRGPSVTPTGL